MSERTERTEAPARARSAPAVMAMREASLRRASQLRTTWPALPDFWRHYRLVTKLGSGSTGDVFLVREKANAQQRFAVKMITDPNVYLDNEVTVLEALADGCSTHNLLCYVTHGTIPRSPEQRETVPVIVTEYIEGVDLFVYGRQWWRLNDRQPPASVVRRILTDILRALQYSHSLGFAHRDVKGENVVIDEAKNRAVLIDWAYACRNELQCGTRKYSGTPCYSSAARLRRGIGRMDLEAPPLSAIDTLQALQADAETIVQRIDSAAQLESKDFYAYFIDWADDLRTLTPLQVMQSGDMWSLGLTMYEFVTGEDAVPCAVADALRDARADRGTTLRALERFAHFYRAQRRETIYSADPLVDDLIHRLLTPFDAARITAAEAYVLLTQNGHGAIEQETL